MPEIFEAFGYPLSDRSLEAEETRRNGLCPFMGAECDGGGNRYLSHIDLNRYPDLRECFRERRTVPSGVCSIQTTRRQPPWIVCPRRLLFLGHSRGDKPGHQDATRRFVLSHSGIQNGPIGVWAEVKLKFKTTTNRGPKSFDYTFDYVLAPTRRARLGELSTELQLTVDRLREIVVAGGYTLSMREGDVMVEDFPSCPPCVVEIMT